MLIILLLLVQKIYSSLAKLSCLKNHIIQQKKDVLTTDVDFTQHIDFILILDNKLLVYKITNPEKIPLSYKETVFNLCKFEKKHKYTPHEKIDLYLNIVAFYNIYLEILEKKIKKKLSY